MRPKIFPFYEISALSDTQKNFRIINEPDKIDLRELRNTLWLCEVIIELMYIYISGIDSGPNVNF